MLWLRFSFFYCVKKHTQLCKINGKTLGLYIHNCVSLHHTNKANIMKATDFTYISKKAKDGKVFRATISRKSGDLNEGWSADGDFFWTSKTACIKATKQALQNQVEDYEYDNNLR